MSNKLTIRDIAQLAGVSTATVSRVLNNKPDVDPATRERVMQVVHEHGFVPSVTASSLAGGRSPLLGVLVPSLTWPLMPQIMQSIAEVIEQTSYELVLYSISHRTDRSELLDRILATRLIDGLLAIYPDGIASAESAEHPHREASTHLLEIYERGFPVVMLDDQSLPGPVPWVGPITVSARMKRCAISCATGTAGSPTFRGRCNISVRMTVMRLPAGAGRGGDCHRSHADRPGRLYHRERARRWHAPVGLASV